jgi:sugar O-acyltransferase (sialic acid O-acetyltransferase NeuD family)
MPEEKPMMPRKVVIFGTGGMAEMAHLFLTEDGGREVAAFTVERDYAVSKTFANLPLVPFDVIAEAYPPSVFELLIAVGPVERNRLRARVFATAESLGYALASYVHSSVRPHRTTTIGRNCLIFDGVSLQPWTRIGDNAIVRPLAYVGHHVRVAAHSFISPNATVLGHSTLGERCFVGAGAVVGPRVTIGAGSMIAANACALESVPASSVVRADERRRRSRA